MNNYLQEAIQIGDHLVETATDTINGISWKTHQIIDNTTITWTDSENIYNGVSGVVIFLLALYQVTKTEKYLETAKKAMEWVDSYCERNSPSNNYAFITGRLGISFTFLKLYKITKNKLFLNKALDNAQGYLNFLKIDNGLRSYTYLNGIGGSLIVLLHLFDAVQEPFLYKAINETAQIFIKKAKYSQVGLYWERSYENIAFQKWPLCGFSHGSSGIGFAFSELGNYFQNMDYFYISQQAFAYDNSRYDNQTGNWPSGQFETYDKDMTKKYEKLFTEGVINAFYETHDYNKWCHGAAGVGLARIHASKYIHNGRYEKDIQQALKKTLQTQLPSSCLCHGNCGNAELFIEYYLLTKDIKYLEHAMKIADNVLLQRKRHGKHILGMYNKLIDEPEDPGLFMGIAGIGYFMLRVIYPEIIESILAPTLSPIQKYGTTTNKYALSYTQSFSIRQQLMGNIFPETIRQIQLLDKTKLSTYFTINPVTDSEIDSFIFFVKNLLLSFNTKEREKLHEIFERELIKFQLRENSNYFYLYIKKRILKKRVEEIITMNKNDFLNLRLQLNSETKIIEQKESLFVIKLTYNSIEEIPINSFLFQILDLFKESKTVQQLIDAFITVNRFDETMKGTVEEKIILQIKEAIKALLLIEPFKEKGNLATEKIIYFK